MFQLLHDVRAGIAVILLVFHWRLLPQGHKMAVCPQASLLCARLEERARARRYASVFLIYQENQ